MKCRIPKLLSVWKAPASTYLMDYVAVSVLSIFSGIINLTMSYDDHDKNMPIANIATINPSIDGTIIYSGCIEAVIFDKNFIFVINDSNDMK